MRFIKRTVFVSTICTAAFLTNSVAQAETNIAIGAKAGTTGFGIEGQFKVSERFIVRTSANLLSFSQDDETIDDVTYDAEIEFNTIGAVIDYHPLNNAFFVSGGVYIGEKMLEFSATPTTNVSIGGAVFTPAEIGRLDGSADFGDVTPYLGVGFSNTFRTSSPWSYLIELGVMFTDTPDIALVSTGGTLSSQPLVQAQIDLERAEIEDDLDGYAFYPVLNAGLAYQF